MVRRRRQPGTMPPALRCWCPIFVVISLPLRPSIADFDHCVGALLSITSKCLPASMPHTARAGIAELGKLIVLLNRDSDFLLLIAADNSGRVARLCGYMGPGGEDTRRKQDGISGHIVAAVGERFTADMLAALVSLASRWQRRKLVKPADRTIKVVSSLTQPTV